MLWGIFCLVITGLIWIGPGAVISNSAKKGLSLDFILGMTAVLTMAIAVPAYFFGNSTVHPVTWIVLPVSGVLNYLCFVIARVAMKKGPSGLTWAMMQSAFIMPFLMGVLFFDVSCSILRGIGLAAMVVSMYLMGCGGQTGEKEDKSKYSRKSVWLFYAFLAFFAAGASQCTFNLPAYFIVEKGGGIDNMIFRAGINSTGAFLIFLCSPFWNKECFKGRGTLISILLLTFTSLCGIITLFTGLETLASHGAGAIGYPVALGSNIAAFLVFTAIRFKERLSPCAVAGVSCCLTGIVLLAM
ncbi:MAG: hypothetical protein IKB99_04780 [Lentisphaeria bacterium]|nr:hypothetical protein [Lentisphaeria bacterium]